MEYTNKVPIYNRHSTVIKNLFRETNMTEKSERRRTGRKPKQRDSVDDLGIKWLIPTSVEKDPKKVEWALRERIKELNCLYAIAQLADRCGNSLDELLNGVVRIIPPSWQYPEATCARITFNSGRC